MATEKTRIHDPQAEAEQAQGEVQAELAGLQTSVIAAERTLAGAADTERAALRTLDQAEDARTRHAARLAELTAAGLVARTVEEGPPIAVSYALTPSGEALMPALAQLSAWATEHLPDAARDC